MPLRTENRAAKARCCGPSDCGQVDKGGARFCIGSRCMAWQWGADGYQFHDGLALSETVENKLPVDGKLVPLPVDGARHARAAKNDVGYIVVKRGYCGLLPGGAG